MFPVSSLISINGFGLFEEVERALEMWERALPGRRGCIRRARGALSESESAVMVEVEVEGACLCVGMGIEGWLGLGIVEGPPKLGFLGSTPELTNQRAL